MMCCSSSHARHKAAIRSRVRMQRAAESLGLRSLVARHGQRTEAQSRLTSLAADLLVVCDYGEILRPETLATARLGGINLHGSLLPKYRGAAPVQWAILRGETETGNSVIQMTPGLDAGPCLGQQRTPIDPDEDAGQLESRLASMGAELVLRVIDALETGTATPIEQDKSLASKAPRLKKEDGAIDWSRRPRRSKTRCAHCAPGPAPSPTGIAKTPNHSASTSTASPSTLSLWKRAGCSELAVAR